MTLFDIYYNASFHRGKTICVWDMPHWLYSEAALGCSPEKAYNARRTRGNGEDHGSRNQDRASKQGQVRVPMLLLQLNHNWIVLKIITVVDIQGWATSGFIRNSGFIFFYYHGKTYLSPASWLFFFIGGKNGGMIRHYCRPATHPDLIGYPYFSVQI